MQDAPKQLSNSSRFELTADLHESRYNSHSAASILNVSRSTPMEPEIEAPIEAAACTVVVCTRNRPAYLRRCLEHIRAQSVPLEILVVDNNPAASEAFEIASSFGAHYILCAQPGLSHARNAGLYACKTEFVAFIDDDAYPDPDWLETLLSEFANPHVAAVMGRIVFEGNPEQTAARARSYACLNNTSPDWFEMTNFGGVGGGMNMAFRRSILGSWKGFEENLGRGQMLNAWEDDYAFFSVVDKGFSVVHAPDARVNHAPRPEKPSRWKTFHTIAMTSAYITLLAVRHPSYLPAIRDFLVGATRRTPRTWKATSPKAFSSKTPTWLVVLAVLAGPFIYLYIFLTSSFRYQAKATFRPTDSSVPTEH